MFIFKSSFLKYSRIFPGHFQFVFFFQDFPGVERTCEANPAGENNSFIFTVHVKSVPLYHLRFAYVVLHMPIKEFSGLMDS